MSFWNYMVRGRGLTWACVAVLAAGAVPALALTSTAVADAATPGLSPRTATPMVAHAVSHKKTAKVVHHKAAKHKQVTRKAHPRAAKKSKTAIHKKHVIK